MKSESKTPFTPFRGLGGSGQPKPLEKEVGKTLFFLKTSS